MARQAVLLILLLLVVLNPRGQKNRSSADYKSLYNYAERLYSSSSPTIETDSLALNAYHQVISLLLRSSGSDSILFDSYVKAGILEMSHQQEAAALTNFISSIKFSEKTKSIADSSLFKSYLYAGTIYYSTFDFDSALYYYRHAETIVNAHPFVNESERLYNKLGVLYFETGDYRKSILYFQKALSLVEARKPVDAFFVVNYKNNIASALRKIRRYNESLTIYKSPLHYGFKTQELLYNIGVGYLDAGRPQEAIQYLQQIQGNEQVKYNDLARAHIQLGRLDSADYFLQKALFQQRLTSSTQKDHDYGITLKYLADVLMGKHQTRQALDKYQQSIIQVDPDFNDTVISHNPNSFFGLHNSYLLFDVLKAKADAFVALFSETKDTKHLINAFVTYSSSLALARHVERMYHSDEAKLFLEENVSGAYKQVVETALQLYELTKEKIYLAKAFSFAENSKASVLQADLHELELNNITGLPEDVLKEQKILTANIARLNMQVTKTGDRATLQKLQNNLRDQEIKLSSLQDKLDDNPKYYQLKFRSKEINIDTIQQKILTKNAALISYYYYKNKLICFYITRDAFGYYLSDMDKELFREIAILGKQLNAPEASDRKLVSSISTALYEKVFAPVASHINDKKHLLIIPYNELSYIPFEALIAPNEDEALLYRYSVSYNYSANFLSDKTNFFDNYQVLAMAPFSALPNGGLPRLLYSKQEVEGLKGKILLDNEATKQQFVSRYNEYPVVHLATHAVVNDTLPLQSYIEFYKQQEMDTTHRLFEQEIYHLNMQQVQLVILSACETGNGQLINQEGVISLSRAFSYAGCKSVITSLWKADDAATAFIIKHVHSYLGRGLEKDEALQQAKIDYLESDEIDARFKTPGYWAHLVLIGNSQAMVKTNHLFYLILALIVAFIAIVVTKKNRTQKAVHGTGL